MSKALAIASSGDMEWVDPFVGARIRHQLAPGKEVMLEGDVGGFGVGSDFSWQLVGTIRARRGRRHRGVTGLVIILFPHVLIRLLFDADVAGAGIVIGRVAGIALISLGLGCWMGRQEASGGRALAAMLIYNSLVTIYLTLVGFGTEFVGILLWPAAALHAALTALLAYPLIETR